MVNYQYGPSDIVSKEYQFETADETYVARNNYVFENDEKINITCEAEVGPSDKFKKTIEWRRSDNTSLPNGLRSIMHPDIPNKAFLVLNKASGFYSGNYTCFLKPAASIGHTEVNVIVNDLTVVPNDVKVDFQNSSEPIFIKCSGSVVKNMKIHWTDSENSEIVEKENEMFKIENVVKAEEMMESTLTIKRPSLNVSGTYHCHKTFGKFRVSRSIIVHGKEKILITVLPNSSPVVGKKTQLRCKAQVAIKSQRMIWSIENKVLYKKKDMFKISYPDPLDVFTQDIEITNDLSVSKVFCKIISSVNSTKNYLEQMHVINFVPNIEVEGPKNVLEGDSVNLMCIGYPTEESMILQWVFYNDTSKNSTNHGTVLVSSENQTISKSVEPITLAWDMPEVKTIDGGRYECRFKTGKKSQHLINKSLTLFVKLKAPIASDLNIARKSAQSLTYVSQLSIWIHLSLTCLSVYSIYRSFL